jgi:hypothetical protein
MTKSTLAAAALVLCSFSGAAIPAEGLPSRAAAALGQVIAAQGNLALAQIRREIQQSALKTIEPFLPSAGDDTDESSEEPADRSAAPTADTSVDKSANTTTDADEPAETPISQRWL